jgi:hypothetical protein
LNATTQVSFGHADHPLGRTFAQVLASSKASAAGFHANSEWLTCPERMRLKAMGVVRRPDEGERSEWAKDGLNALSYGTLIHELLALRVCWGQAATAAELGNWRGEIGEKAYASSMLILAVYEQTIPEAHEPLRFLGVEVEVITNVVMRPGTGPGTEACMRTVRYDGVVYATTPGGQQELYSLERKTMARSGYSALFAYYPQGMTQVALWNANPELVAAYGEMKGVIYEAIVKTKMPSVDRQPTYFTRRQQLMALDYMRYSENGMARFAQAADGSFPRMLHSCWGRWRPCDYIGLCHDELTAAYMMKDGSDL